MNNNIFTQFQLSVGVTFSLTLEKAMVGDLGESLWLRQIFGSVYGENRPLCHIGYIMLYAFCVSCLLKFHCSTGRIYTIYSAKSLIW